MSGAAAKPLPKSDPTTAPFWDRVKNEAMALQYSPATGTYLFHPRGFYPAARASAPHCRQHRDHGACTALRATQPRPDHHRPKPRHTPHLGSTRQRPCFCGH